jgi:hypothetical protein
VKRRDFLKTTAAVATAAAVPVSLVSGASVPAIPWASFCCEESWKYDVSVPWVRNGWRIATNHVMLIRQKVAQSDAFSERVPCAKPSMIEGTVVGKLATGRDTGMNGSWSPWPDRIPTYFWSDCDECRGTRLSAPRVVCPDCKNSEFVELCSRCGGFGDIGTVECLACKGAKQHPKRPYHLWLPSIQYVGRHALDIKNADLIRSLHPAVEFAETRDLVVFRGPTFEGAVMGIDLEVLK